MDRKKIFSDGSEHIEQYCLLCLGHIRYVRKPFTKAEALQFVIPFGKHKGKKIIEVMETNFDYCLWAAENIKNSTGDKIRLAIKNGE